MGIHLLLAAVRITYRAELCAFLADDSFITSICEAGTQEELHHQLAANSIDCVIVDQSLITDVTILPQGCFVIVASELDDGLYESAREHEVKGYFLANLDNLTKQLLCIALRLDKGKCLLDPALTPKKLPSAAANALSSSSTELLTSREKEIVALLHENPTLKNKELASRLSISVGTVKKHREHIARKLHLLRRRRASP